jgi:hypothetical protein
MEGVAEFARIPIAEGISMAGIIAKKMRITAGPVLMRAPEKVRPASHSICSQLRRHGVCVRDSIHSTLAMAERQLATL